MRTRGAVLFEQPGAWHVVDLDLDEPRDHEVLVRIAATGLCHSDYHWQKGTIRPYYLPVCGGHEGSGIVEAIGRDVRDVAVGDHIVTSFIPSCGRCKWCASGQQNLCDNGALMFAGTQLDGTYRMHYEGKDVGQSCCLSTFSELSVIPEWACIKIDHDIPLSSAALVACGVPTGWGSAVNAAAVKPGDVVIVAGVGGIGINAAQGAKHAGASRVLVVDPNEFHRKFALDIAATEVFAHISEATEAAKAVTNGQGADAVILCMGTLAPEFIAEAFNAIRKGGTVVVTAAAPQDVYNAPVNLLELTMYQKRIQGSLFGMMSPNTDVPRLLDLYKVGQLKLDELITTTYSLDQINEAYDDLEAGKNIRGVILFD